MQLTEDQTRAVDAIHDFFQKGDRPLMTMGGYAGTGKTTVVAHAIASLETRPPVAFCAFSGKAASVLKSKLERASALKPGDYVGTIHGLIYKPFERFKPKKADDKDEQLKFEEASEGVAKRTPIKGKQEQNIGFALNDDGFNQSIVVMDEASMCSGSVFDDLKGFGKPILAVGDHGQLPPVMGSFNLMEKPEIRLEKIHRQAEGDPIVRLSMMARQEGRIPLGEYGDGVRKIQRTGDLGFATAFTRDTMVLCGTNQTRVFWNNFLRTQIGYTSDDPEVGERVICLKNNREKEIYNGMTGVLQSIASRGRHWYEVSILMDSGLLFEEWVFKHQFGSPKTIFEFRENGEDMPPWRIGNLFDWAYCMTVHKSQGSEAEDVVVLEERISRTDDEWRRWLYTAVTRAKKKLLIVGS
jgi:exodeoxyribonuclease-5